MVEFVALVSLVQRRINSEHPKMGILDHIRIVRRPSISNDFESFSCVTEQGATSGVWTQIKPPNSPVDSVESIILPNRHLISINHAPILGPIEVHQIPI